MASPRPEIVLRDGVIYRLTRLPDGQKRVSRSRKARRMIPRPIVHRDPGDETRAA